MNLETVNLILFCLSALFWLLGFWFLFYVRIPRQNDKRKEQQNLSLSIIIPARNEEINIGKLLDSINSQNVKPLEVIVVNDGSTDLTKQISLEKGAIVHDSKPLPEGWLGKPWACFQGANIAKGEIFIFLDADTELEKNGLGKIVDTFKSSAVSSPEKEKVVMSILPYHKVIQLYEDSSAIFNLIMASSMNAFTPLKNSHHSGLFGQSLIISRGNYFMIGGHERVKDKILENFYLSKILKDEHFKLICLGGKGSLSFRMYPDGISNLIYGWAKAFASGAGLTPVPTLIMIIMWISSGLITFIMLAVTLLIFDSGYDYWMLMYVLFFLQYFRMLRMLGSFKIYTSVFYPLHLLFFVIIFSMSLYFRISKKKVQWKSRDV